ncbi:DUF2812 domain-containing protein [Alkalicoccobacillus murimartini]|uniref:DUF2812 domain-containing protein n=1 Tax=Alkalicoccobacillus murimartini TaxID=171685 RepID=A0ABT9YIV4_9BACI|nr:DUF2812 domain-containing protein [Alkalicoccobacillus murimartini]MDQ0207786.1 hypothetical protein [Alkalicoccobacillus murimartini]
MKNKNKKTVSKRFSSFEKEEEWLLEMFKKGWKLSKYDSEEFDESTYSFQLTSETDESIIYRIDYRELKNKEEYDEYKELFNETGWTILSKGKNYTKHIFYTTSTNKKDHIFSDSLSLAGREKRKMTHSLLYFIITLSLCFILILLYFIFRQSVFMGVGFMTFFGSFKYLLDYLKCRKTFNAYSKAATLD